MQAETLDSAHRLNQLENRIARLKRRVEQLDRVSNKYWTVRRVLFICGALLTLSLCKYSGQVVGWVLAASFAVVFWLVAGCHRKVRDSIARHTLMIEIKQIQMARILWTGTKCRLQIRYMLNRRSQGIPSKWIWILLEKGHYIDSSIPRLQEREAKG